MSHAAEVLSQSTLIIGYPLDEASGTNADDVGANDLDATLNNGPSVVTGLIAEYANSRQFAAGTQFGERAHDSTMAKEYIAVEMIVNVTADRNGVDEDFAGKLNTGGWEYLLSRRAPDDAVNPGEIYFQVFSSGGVGFSAFGSALSAGTSYHVVGKYTPAGFYVFVDGYQVGFTAIGAFPGRAKDTFAFRIAIPRAGASDGGRFTGNGPWFYGSDTVDPLPAGEILQLAIESGFADPALTVEDAQHGHTADNVALTVGLTVLTVQDALHGHTADNVSLPLGTSDLLSVTGIHTTGGTLNLTPNGAVEVHYQTVLSTDPGFTVPLDEAFITDASRFFRDVTGRTPGQSLRSRARWRMTAGGAWSAWLESTPQIWTVLFVNPGRPSGAFTAPLFGEPIAGVNYCLAVTLDAGRSITTIELSDDYGASWAAIGALCFDTTAQTDGFYLARVTLDNAEVIEHAGFRIDNAGVVVWHETFDGSEPFVAQWSPSTPFFLLSGPSCLTGAVSHLGTLGNGEVSSFGLAEPDWLLMSRGVSISAELLPVTTGGGLPWERMYGSEVLDMAVVVQAQGTQPGADGVGIRAGIWHWDLSPSWSGGDGVDGYRYVGVGQGQFFVTIGDTSIYDTSAGGPSRFTEDIPVATGWTYMSGAGWLSGISIPPSACVLRPYKLLLNVWRPDPTGFPNRIRVFARLTGYDAYDPSLTFTSTIDQTVDLAAPFDCGHVAWASRKTVGAGSGDSIRAFRHVSVTPIGTDTCALPPPTVTTTQPQSTRPPGLPCELVLEAYAEDRVTLDWEVSTSQYHIQPWLCLPQNYGEQEIDVVAGAATIAQVEVVVIDKPQTANNQQTGWLTERIQDVHGRRHRLIRYIDPTIGWVVIADGPAAAPRMDDSYAAYKWAIRDTRETERKFRAFAHTMPRLPLGSPAVTDLSQFLSVSLVPPGPVPTFGTIPAAVALQGVYEPPAGAVSDAKISFQALWPGDPLLDQEITPDLILTPGAARQLAPQITQSNGQWTYTWPNIRIAYRDTVGGSWYLLDPWFTWPVGWGGPGFLLPEAYAAHLADGTTVQGVYKISLGSPFFLPWTPASGQAVEVMIINIAAASEDTPYYISGITTGQFLQNAYDGVYSQRDVVTGAIVPTGIRYDAAALAQMTDLVSLRLVEPIKDLRDWTEKYIYAPTGWVPALDSDGRISPVSQVPPAPALVVDTIDNDITEPSPNWDAGERVVNFIAFTYPRYYIPATGTAGSADGLLEREVIYEYQDSASIEEHGEQKFDYEGIAFAAFGDGVGAGTGTELGATLADLRQIHVLGRFRDGAQAIDVVVRRSTTAHLRAGDWVRTDLSWFPNYVTGQRDAQLHGQIIAIADLDCVWRRLLIEEAPEGATPLAVDDAAHAHAADNVTLA
jgi:hypothetical protein